jgi:ABC-2 type transport system permease protein
MNLTVARLTARSLLGRRRTLLLLALPALLLLLSVAIRWIAGTDADLTVNLLAGFALGTIVPLLGLIAGTGAIGPEIDDGSIVYLLSKPLSRFTIVFSKLAVAVGIMLAFCAVPTLIAGLVLTGGTRNLALGFAAGAAVAGVTYCALFLLLAVLTRNAVIIGLLYALVWESVVGQFVPGARALSVQQWSLSVVQAVVAAPAGGGAAVRAAVSLTTGCLALAAVLVASTVYAGWRLRSLRLTGEDA